MPMDKNLIPGCTYCHPQVASVGLDRGQGEGGRPRDPRRPLPFVGNGKAIALGEDQGLVKVIFDKKTGQLLGAHMIGAEVTELIQGYVVAMNLETTEEELMHTVFPHPTLSEMMKEAVLGRLWTRAEYVTERHRRAAAVIASLKRSIGLASAVRASWIGFAGALLGMTGQTAVCKTRRKRQPVKDNDNLTIERPTFVTHLECAMEGDHYAADQVHNLSKAGKPLLVRYDLAGVKKALTKDALAAASRRHVALPRAAAGAQMPGHRQRSAR